MKIPLHPRGGNLMMAITDAADPRKFKRCIAFTHFYYYDHAASFENKFQRRSTIEMFIVDRSDNWVREFDYFRQSPRMERLIISCWFHILLKWPYHVFVSTRIDFSSVSQPVGHDT